jgi:hypothetical protein
MPKIRGFVFTGAFLAFALAIVSVTSADPKIESPVLRAVRDKAGHPIAVDAVGLRQAELLKLSKQDDARDAFSRLLAVYVVHEPVDDNLPPLAGDWSVVDSSLRFTPRFPLLAGTRYLAVLRPAELVGGSEKPPRPITLEIAVSAKDPGEPTEVVHVYPSSAAIPENNLRFYIHFSESMGRGEAYSHLHLLDGKEKPIPDCFLEIGEELWDPRARRMTLLIEPGRIKKGVQPRDELGPVLEAGREYTLVIDRHWRDAAGRPLKAEFRKTFRALPPVEAALDPAAWKIQPPIAGTLDPLVLRFPAPLDRALLERTISVAGLTGPAVPGRVSIYDEERRWEFRPNAPWKTGRYQFVIDTALEDLAGNRIGKPFEVDEFSEVEKTTETEPARLPFEVRERS